MNSEKLFMRVTVLFGIGFGVLALAAILTLVATSIAENFGKPSPDQIDYHRVVDMNACCWFRVVGDWKPGRVRHWFAGRDAVAVVEDQATGYCHLVGLEDINFSQEKPW